MTPRQIVTVSHWVGCSCRQWAGAKLKAVRDRDSIGRKRRGIYNAFLVFRCNDTDCPAQMIMPWHEAEEALHLNEKKDGKKK